MKLSNSEMDQFDEKMEPFVHIIVIFKTDTLLLSWKKVKHCYLLILLKHPFWLNHSFIIAVVFRSLLNLQFSLHELQFQNGSNFISKNAWKIDKMTSLSMISWNLIRWIPLRTVKVWEHMKTTRINKRWEKITYKEWKSVREKWN